MVWDTGYLPGSTPNATNKPYWYQDLSAVFEEGKEYFSEVMPCEMGEEREVTDYREILFERNGKSIRAKAKDLWELENGERIVFI